MKKKTIRNDKKLERKTADNAEKISNMEVVASSYLYNVDWLRGSLYVQATRR